MKPKLRKSWTFKSLKLMGNSLLQLLYAWIIDVLKEDQNVDYLMNHQMGKTGCLSGERLLGVLLSVTYYCSKIHDSCCLIHPWLFKNMLPREGKPLTIDLIYFYLRGFSPIVLVVWCSFLVDYITTIGSMRLGTAVEIFHYTVLLLQWILVSI